MAKRKDREITIIDRRSPRVAIQITEIVIDPKTKTRRRESVAHLTVTNLSGQEAKRIIIKAHRKASGIKEVQLKHDAAARMLVLIAR